MLKSSLTRAQLLYAFLIPLFCLQQSDVFGHFLFIRIGEHAEAGRAVEVFFSEKAEAGDPRFIGKVSGTQLWMQRDPGKFFPLKSYLGTDRLRAYLPADLSVSVTGYCEYGVLEREVPFLLRYYPKAIAGSIADVNAFMPNDNSTLEIVPTVSSDSISLVLLDHGKPVPDVVFTTIDDYLNNVELKANREGQVTWKPTGSGYYCVYTKVVRQNAGELAGKKYQEIREFATLAFGWPLERTDGDPEAIELFEKAISTRASWVDFPGFSADIDGTHDGRSFSGSVQIAKDGAVELKIDQPVAEDWVNEQLKSLVTHRMESSRRSPPVLRFADQDVHNPLGRLLTFVGGRFASSYRVKDNQLKVVNRNLGTENMTITVLENDKTLEGKYLPHLYNVQYWNAVNGSLQKTETFENRWERIGKFDLPALNTLLTSSATGLGVRGFRLTNHSLRPAE